MAGSSETDLKKGHNHVQKKYIDSGSLYFGVIHQPKQR